MKRGSGSSPRWRLTEAAVREIQWVVRARANLMQQLRDLPSAAELAAQLGVTPSTIFRVMAGGNKTPPPQMRVGLANELMEPEPDVR